MIKYFSQMSRRAQDPETPELDAAPAQEEAPVETPSEGEIDPTQDLNDLDESTPETENASEPEKDAVKFKLWAEKEAKKAGYTVEIVPSSSNRAVKVNIDDSTDIITQKDAIKLAVALDNNPMSWHLMDDPIVKGGGAWVIKFSKVEV